MQVQTADHLLQLILTSRVIDVGAILVSITAVVVTTRNTLTILKKNLEKLNQIIENQQTQLQKHEIQLAHIEERCNLLTREGAACVGAG